MLGRALVCLAVMVASAAAQAVVHTPLTDAEQKKLKKAVKESGAQVLHIICNPPAGSPNAAFSPEKLKEIKQCFKAAQKAMCKALEGKPRGPAPDGSERENEDRVFADDTPNEGAGYGGETYPETSVPSSTPGPNPNGKSITSTTSVI